MSASHNINFSTIRVGSQELLLTVTDISRDIHNTTFICDVVNILRGSINVTNRMKFVLITEELSKPLKVQVISYSIINM